MKSVQQEQQQPSSMDSSDSATTTGSSEYAYRPLTTKHRRAGSTGTTGDEEYTTDEDEYYGDEADCAAGPTSHPILKSDLARAATDLFGYASGKRDEELDEPTSLFDEDEVNHRQNSVSKQLSLFTYNEGGLLPRGVIARRRASDAAKSPSPSPSSSTCATKPFEAQNGHDAAAAAAGTEALDRRLKEEKLGAGQQTTTTTTPCNGEIRAERLEREDRKSEALATATAPGPNRENQSTTSVDVNAIPDAKSEFPVKADFKKDESDPPSPSTVQWGRAVAEVKEQAIAKLQEELHRAHEELKLKDEEVARLSRIRQDVEAELEELTASLFQEAHNMVREANQRQANAERLLEESRMKAEVLAAEVAALKTLVLTSTPARPNPHLHPQIAGGCVPDDGHQTQNGGMFAKKHRRSPSHFNLKYGRESSPPDSPQREQRTSLPCDPVARDAYERDLERERDREREKKRERERDKDSRDLGLEVDPRVHGEFLRWKANACFDKSEPFVERIFREDIDLCLDFPNQELGARVRQAVLDGIIFVEAVSDKAKLGFPKKCALLEAPRQCHYRMRMGDQENQWHSISQICRNRIISVCDFLNYLRYIERGLVKSSVHDVYWEITRLRKEMVLARLGLALSSG